MLAEFVTAVRARHAEVVQDLIVYDLKARGDWHDDSDIGVLVIVADGASERDGALRHLALNVSDMDEAWPSILTRDRKRMAAARREGPPLRRGIERDGLSVW